MLRRHSTISVRNLLHRSTVRSLCTSPSLPHSRCSTIHHHQRHILHHHSPHYATPQSYRTFSTHSSWRPGSRRSAAAEEPDNDEDEELAREAAHKRAEAEFRAKQQQQQQDESKRKAAEEEQTNNTQEEESIHERLQQARPNRTRTTRRSRAEEDANNIIDDTSLSNSPPTTTSTSSSLPTLKSQLRKFFLQVHPDLFESTSNSKEQRETNAKNLAVLTDFLDAMKSGGNVRGGGQKSAKVVFWVKEKEKQQTHAATSATASAVSNTASSPPSSPSSQFYKITSTLTLPSSQSSNRVLHASLYASLSSLFKQAGILHANHWQWGEEYEGMGKREAEKKEESTSANQSSSFSQQQQQQQQSSPNSSYDDEYFSRYATESSSTASTLTGRSGEFEAFIRSIRGVAHHYEVHSTKARHEYLLRLANLRLQGMKIVFEPDASQDEEFDRVAETMILDVFEDVMKHSKYFKPPKPMYSPPTTSSASGGSAYKQHSASGVASHNYNSNRDNEPQQPQTPFSQTVQMPEGFSAMFEQIKKHQEKEDGKTTTTTTGANASPSSTQSQPSSSFESTRSPFTRVPCVFSSTSSRCHIDVRGRLIFSLRQSQSAWQQFIDSSPQLIENAMERQMDYKALKALERQTAECVGVEDIFAEMQLMDEDEEESDPSSTSSSYRQAYIDFLTRLQREAHLLRDLHSVFPAYHTIRLRVSVAPTGELPSATSPALDYFTVDPTLGLLLVPLHASVSDVRQTILERGQECVQIRMRQEEDVLASTNSSLHAKRHLRLRGLTSAPHITRDQLLECTDKLTRVYGSLRDLLQGVSLRVSDEYACQEEEDGVITIKADWS